MAGKEFRRFGGVGSILFVKLKCTVSKLACLYENYKFHDINGSSGILMRSHVTVIISNYPIFPTSCTNCIKCLGWGY